jgi:predicted lipid-binding transport protein (Tim44 family)
MSGRLRAGGAFGYLLLVVMLTLGVFVMHTMGHPEESSGHGMSGAVPAVVDGHQDGMAPKAAAAEAPAEPELMAEHGTAASAATSPVHELPSGMDPMSVCVAVLTVWLLGLILRAAAARRHERLTALLARSMALARPSTPPPRPLLSQLSVLRI